jgi:methyl-accepting chemotaxis protein
MRQRSITTLIYRIVALALVGVALNSGINAVYSLKLRRNASTMREVNLAVTRTLFKVSNILRLQGALVTAAPGIPDMALIKTNQAQFEELESQLDKTLVSIQTGNASLAELLRGITNQIPARHAHAMKVFSLAVSFQQTEALETCQKSFTPADARIAGDAIKAGDLALDDVSEKPAQILRLVATSNILSLAGGGLTFIAVLVFSIWTLQRGILRPMRKTTGSLSTASDSNVQTASQISNASQSLAEGASEQAASLEQTSASLEEMASMTQRNAENARKANDLAREARLAADKGATDMQAMATAMDAIKASSDDIAKIIKTIDEIAFQTNILALNAAVEAARAGEAGMGFAVVAGEVRSLAQRSAQAARDTAAMIESAIARAAQGVEINAKVGSTLADIVTKARQVDELVAEIATASKEQSQGISQLNTAVSQMDKVTQHNAANAEESAAAAQELNAQSQVLRKAVAELQVLVGGLQRETSNTGPSASNPVPHSQSQGAPASSNEKHPLKVHARNVASASDSAPAPRRGSIPMKDDFEDFQPS